MSNEQLDICLRLARMQVMDAYQLGYDKAMQDIKQIGQSMLDGNTQNKITIREQITQFFSANPETWYTPKQIGDAVGVKNYAVYAYLPRLVFEGVIQKRNPETRQTEYKLNTWSQSNVTQE